MIAWEILHRDEGKIDAVGRERAEVIGRCFIEERGRDQGFGKRIDTGQRNILKLTGGPGIRRHRTGERPKCVSEIIDGVNGFHLRDYFSKR